jgi:hypothetical protein
MTTLPNDDHEKSQKEVQRLLGRCLLRIQIFEQNLKAFIAHHDISGTVYSSGTSHNFEAELETRKSGVAGKTLGSLMGALFESVVVPCNFTPPEKDDTPPKGGACVRSNYYVALPDEDYERIKSELKEFVELRNNLVHHFWEKHDLGSVEGCRNAQDVLTAADERISHHRKQLVEWAEDIQKARKHFADLLKTDWVMRFMVNGIAPDGTVHWPLAGIVYALRAAAGKLSVDGWTSVDEASHWISEQQPEQTPEKYGCRSLRQVLHESGIFELRYFKVDGRRLPRYREKQGLTEAPKFYQLNIKS